jgi:hypothetical protein
MSISLSDTVTINNATVAYVTMPLNFLDAFSVKKLIISDMDFSHVNRNSLISQNNIDRFPLIRARYMQVSASFTGINFSNVSLNAFLDINNMLSEQVQSENSINLVNSYANKLTIEITYVKFMNLYQPTSAQSTQHLVPLVQFSGGIITILEVVVSDILSGFQSILGISDSSSISASKIKFTHITLLESLL